MSKANIFDLLLKKFDESSLAHFYIISARSNLLSSHNGLEVKVKEFLSRAMAKSLNLDDLKALDLIEQGHSDISWTTPLNPGKNYSLSAGDFDDFFKFLNYKPMHLHWRFAVIDQAHLITEQIYNKLLKTLESTPANTTIILLNPTDKKLLDTIHSRAINLSVNLGDEQSLNNLHQLNFKEWLSAQNWSEQNELNEFALEVEKQISSNFDGVSGLIETISAKANYEEYFEFLITSWAQGLAGDYQIKKSFIDKMQQYQMSKTFNNSKGNRLLSLYSLTLNH